MRCFSASAHGWPAHSFALFIENFAIKTNNSELQVKSNRIYVCDTIAHKSTFVLHRHTHTRQTVHKIISRVDMINCHLKIVDLLQIVISTTVHSSSSRNVLHQVLILFHSVRMILVSFFIGRSDNANRKQTTYV